MYKVQISSHAKRQIKKLPKEAYSKLIPRMSTLKNHPHIHHLKKLEGRVTNDWRLRIGDFRVLYEVNESSQEILIYSVIARKDAYR